MLVALVPPWSSHTSSHHQPLSGLILRCVYWYGDVTKEDLQAAIRMVLELKPIKEISVLEATRIFVEVLMSFRCSQTVCGFFASDSCFKMMPLKSLEQHLRWNQVKVQNRSPTSACQRDASMMGWSHWFWHTLIWYSGIYRIDYRWL